MTTAQAFFLRFIWWHDGQYPTIFIVYNVLSSLSLSFSLLDHRWGTLVNFVRSCPPPRTVMCEGRFFFGLARANGCLLPNRERTLARPASYPSGVTLLFELKRLCQRPSPQPPAARTRQLIHAAADPRVPTDPRTRVDSSLKKTEHSSKSRAPPVRTRPHMRTRSIIP